MLVFDRLSSDRRLLRLVSHLTPHSDTSWLANYKSATDTNIDYLKNVVPTEANFSIELTAAC